MSLSPFVAELQRLCLKAAIDDMAGATWHLCRKRYARAGDAKRYALASAPIGGIEVDALAVFHAVPAGAKVAHLVQGTTILEVIEGLPTIADGECVEIGPARGWNVDVGTHDEHDDAS